MPVQTATETLVKPAGKFSRVPLETYTVQINKVDQTPKNGAARDLLTCEILAPDSVPYLDGTELDYAREGLNEGFKFNNPNVKDQCGCGESFNV